MATSYPTPMSRRRPNRTSPRTPAGETFVKLTRDLLESEAWRSLGINARRFIDFLMLEHLRHGGRQNGKLKAPQRQLAIVGVDSHYAARAIREAEAAGLVDAHRHGIRVATTYTLTWLPLCDGTPPGNRWRPTTPKPGNLPDRDQTELRGKRQADGRICTSKVTQIRSKPCVAKIRPYLVSVSKR